MGPGFDCFGMAVSLHLEVDVREASQLSVTAEGAAVPLDRTNLIVSTMLDALPPGTEPRFALHLKNRIPLARGLGSSATARVAGLALAELWKKESVEVDRHWIAREAGRLEGHPDNATPAVHGGFCVSGPESYERIEMDSREYLAFIPALEIHTEAARTALPKRVSLEDAVFNLQRSALAAARVALHRHLGAIGPFEDRLHQRHRLALDSRLERAFAGLRCLPGVDAAFLSGSGPTVFVIAQSLDALIPSAKGVFQSEGLVVDAVAVRVDNEGLRFA